MKRAILAAAVLFCVVSCKTAETPPPASQAKLADKDAAPAPAAVPDAPVKPAEPVPARPFVAPASGDVVKVVTARPVIAIKLAFRTGSIDDPPGKEGLTALTTRLMVEGGTKSLSSSQILEALYPLAGELDGDADKELTVFSGRVPKEKLDAFLKIFSEVVLAPRLDQKELDRLRSSALNTVRTRLRTENDEQLGKVVLDSVLYAGHPYGHFTEGTVAGLSAITLDDVKAHWKNVFTQDRLILGLAGAVDARLEKQIKAVAAKLPPKGAPAVVLPAAPGVHGKTVIVRKDTASTAESFGFAYGLRRGDPDFVACALAASYLGEHRQSHGVLFQELREKRGLNYGDYAYVEHFEQEGWSSIARVNIPRSTQDMSLWVRPVEPKNAVFAARGAIAYYRALLTDPIPDEKLQTAKGFLIGYTHQWEATDARRLGWAIDNQLYGTPNFLDGYRAALARLTAAEVQAAAARHFIADDLNFVFVTKDADGLAAQLKGRLPSPITYSSAKPPEVTEKDAVLEKTPLPMPSSLISVVDVADVMEH